MPESNINPQHIAKASIAKSFSDAATQYDEFAHIQHVLAKTLLELCPQTDKQTVLDLGCGTGYCLPLLQKIYTKANITGADLAQGMLDHASKKHPQFNYQIADAEALPFKKESFDLIFSNLAVQWCDDFSQVLSEAYSVLKPGGHLVLSTLADGTLIELKQAWASVDGHQHVNQFESQIHLQSMIEKSKFTALQVAFNTHIDFHPNVRSLTDSLKRIGAHNITQGRAKGLTTPGMIRQFKKSMEGFKCEQGLPARYVVLNVVLQK